MMPDGYLSHHYEGRTRIRVPEKEGDDDYFETVKNALNEVDHVEDVDINPFTGSLLVWHTSSTEHIRDYLQEEELMSLILERGSADPETSVFTDALTEQLRSLNRNVLKFTQGGLDARGVVFLALFAGGLYQIAHKRILPSGVTLVKYAFETLFP